MPHAAGWVVAWLRDGTGQRDRCGPPRRSRSAFWIPLARRGCGGRRWLPASARASWAGFYTRELWRPLHRSTFRVVRSLLSMVIPQTVDHAADDRVGTAAFAVDIDEPARATKGSA